MVRHRRTASHLALEVEVDWRDLEYQVAAFDALPPPPPQPQRSHHPSVDWELMACSLVTIGGLEQRRRREWWNSGWGDEEQHCGTGYTMLKT